MHSHNRSLFANKKQKYLNNLLLFFVFLRRRTRCYFKATHKSGRQMLSLVFSAVRLVVTDFPDFPIRMGVQM